MAATVEKLALVTDVWSTDLKVAVDGPEQTAEEAADIRLALSDLDW